MVKAGTLVLAVGLLVSGPLAAKPPLDYADPPADPPPSGQLRPATPRSLPGDVPDRLVGPGPFRRLPSIDESEWVTFATRTQPYWMVGKADPVLTNACRLGAFASVPLNRLVVRFTGKEGRGFLQVIPPSHRFLLFDARGLARPAETYYFKDTGLTSCQVWVSGQGAARKLDAERGTSLPKPDPKALAKRKKLIQSWP